MLEKRKCVLFPLEAWWSHQAAIQGLLKLKILSLISRLRCLFLSVSVSNQHWSFVSSCVWASSNSVVSPISCFVMWVAEGDGSKGCDSDRHLWKMLGTVETLLLFCCSAKASKYYSGSCLHNHYLTLVWKHYYAVSNYVIADCLFKTSG